MAENSKIEWCHHTFNPWVGCTKISDACDHCYAEVTVARFAPKGTDPSDTWGPHAERLRTSTANWNKVHTWNRKAKAAGVRHRVFVASLADVFDNHKSIQQEWRDDLWQLIRDCPDLDFLLLTKRPQNAHRMLPTGWGGGMYNENGYENVWVGTTVENMDEAERRIPALLEIPATVRFLSCEPMIGPINLTHLRVPDSYGSYNFNSLLGVGQDHLGNKFESSLDGQFIHWVICGGESAPDAVRRDMKPAWAKSLADQCMQANVPFLFKQWSGRNQRDIKAKGRELDGFVFNQYPEGADND